MTTLPQLSPEYIEEYSGGRLVALAASLIVIITFFVSLRFYARWLSKTKWGLDDYLVLLSLALLIGASGLAICKCCRFFQPQLHVRTRRALTDK